MCFYVLLCLFKIFKGIVKAYSINKNVNALLIVSKKGTQTEVMITFVYVVGT